MAQGHSVVSSKLYLVSKSLLILPHFPLDPFMLQTLYFSLCQFNTQETLPTTNIPFIPVPHPRQDQRGAGITTLRGLCGYRQNPAGVGLLCHGLRVPRGRGYFSSFISPISHRTLPLFMPAEPSSGGHRCLLGLRPGTCLWENREGSGAWPELEEWGWGRGRSSPAPCWRSGSAGPPHRPPRWHLSCSCP